jgi:hypothetical protein
MTDHYLLEALSILIPILIGVPSSAYFSLHIQRKMKKDDIEEIIKNMKNAIKLELEKNLTGIEKGHTSFLTSEGKKGSTDVIYFETPAYESSVKSGNFILLSEIIRQGISEIYGIINNTNYLTEKLVDSQFILRSEETQTQFSETRKSKLDNLSNMQKEIKDKTEEILKEF